MKTYQIAYEIAGKLSSTFSSSMFSASESLQSLNNKLKDINTNQKNINSFVKLEEDIKKTSTALNDARKKVLDLSKEIMSAGVPTKQQSRNLEETKLKVESLSNKLGTQKQKLFEVKNELKSAGVNTKNLSAENERLAQSTIKAQAAQEKLRNILSKRKQLEDQMQNLKGKAIGAAATAGSMLYPIKAYAEAEDAAVQLKVAMMDSNGAVGESYQKIVKLATDLGNKLPGTTAQFQEMMTMLKRQGMSDESILSGLGKATAYLGVMLQKSPKDAAEFAAKLQDATATSEKDMVGLADTIQKTFYLGVDSNNMLAFFGKMNTAMAMVKKNGLEFANTFAPMAAMFDQAGMSGEASGNALQKIIQAGFDTDKIKKANKAAGVNLSFTNGKGEFGGLENLYKQFEKLKKLTTEQRTMYLKDAFGDDAETKQAISILMNKGIEGYRETHDKMQKQADIQKRIDAQLGTLSKTWESFTGTMTNFMAAIGKPIADSILPVLSKINDWIGDSLFPWLEANKELADGITKVVFGLAAFRVAVFAVGTAWALLKAPIVAAQGAYVAFTSSALIMSAVSKVATAGMWLFNAALAANPIVWVTAGIAGLIAMGVLLYKNWDEIKAKFNEIWNGIVNWFNNISLYEAGMKLINSFGDGIVAAKDALFDTLKEVWDKAQEYNPFADKPNSSSPVLSGALSGAGLKPNSSPMSVTYSPNVTIQGNASKEDMEKAISQGNTDFLSKLKSVQSNNQRLSYE